MLIRWKLLILLLAIAVLPAITASLIGRSSGRAMGREITTDISEMLIDSAYEQLQRIVERAVAMLERDRAIIETAADIQAQAAERLLAGAPIVPGRAYLDSEFDDPGTPPPALELSERHGRYDESGSLIPMPVSYRVSSIRLSPGVRPEAVSSDLARLASLTGIYAFVNERHPDLIRWQYTALESGVQSTYPGHGGYPESYDARKRPWYTQTKAAGTAQWVPPVIDASTRQVVLTRAVPVERADGSFAGVTAIDVPMTQIVQRLELPDEWRPGAKVTLALLLRNRLTGEPALTVVAQQAYTQTERSWDLPVELEVLRSEDEAEFEALLENIRAGVPSLHRMPHQGRDCLWAIGPIDQQTIEGRDVPEGTLIIIVPFEDILARVGRSETMVQARLDEQFQFTGMLLIGSIIVVVVVAFLASRVVTRPVRHLAATAGRVAAGDLEARADVSSSDEIGALAKAFNTMVPQLQDRLRLKESLALAMEVQQHLLPAAPPHVDGLDVAGCSVYCDETGGDYFDFLHFAEFGPRILGVAIGDVTGHGIAAALLMTTARALLKIRAPQSGDVASIITDMNRHLAADTPAGKFMTFCYLVADADRRAVRWVSAGHDPALLYDPAADSFEELAGRDVPLGVDESWEFHEQERGGLEFGHVLMLGTDGIWEARNEAGEMFGKERLRDVIRANATRSSEEIVQTIIDAVVTFRAGREQEDDITLIVVRVEEEGP